MEFHISQHTVNLNLKHYFQSVQLVLLNLKRADSLDIFSLSVSDVTWREALVHSVSAVTWYGAL